MVGKVIRKWILQECKAGYTVEASFMVPLLIGAMVIAMRMGIGCYEEKQKTLIYSVINSEAKRELLPLIRQIDPHAFINVVRTEELAGRFHDIPHD